MINPESQAELACCPFCSGTPRRPSKSDSSDERNGYNFTISIQCSSCGAKVAKSSHQDKNGWCDDKGEAMADAIAAWNRRAAPPSTPAVPEGWKLVPVEPTTAMLVEMKEVAIETVGLRPWDSFKDVLTKGYTNVLHAAPQPPKEAA